MILISQMYYQVSLLGMSMYKMLTHYCHSNNIILILNQPNPSEHSVSWQLINDTICYCRIGFKKSGVAAMLHWVCWLNSKQWSASNISDTHPGPVDLDCFHILFVWQIEALVHPLKGSVTSLSLSNYFWVLQAHW